jgi:hypothetical protein
MEHVKRFNVPGNVANPTVPIQDVSWSVRHQRVSITLLRQVEVKD